MTAPAFVIPDSPATQRLLDLIFELDQIYNEEAGDHPTVPAPDAVEAAQHEHSRS